MATTSPNRTSPANAPDSAESGGATDSVGLVEIKYYTFAHPPEQMRLDCGRRLGPITLAYETYGELDEDASNAILIVHALSGDAHAAGRHAPDDPKPGWWDNMIGPGKAFDTNKYFVICSNVIGGCQGSTGPSSIDPDTGKPFGLNFPIITISDMVRAQTRLVDYLGIDRLLAVAGGSMGGMQTLEWCCRYPGRVRSALVIASTPLLGAQALAFDAVGRNAIQADPAYHDGDYYDREVPAQGLSIARMLAHITYLSDVSMRAKFGRALQNSTSYNWDFNSEFSVETYLDYQGAQFVNRFDANSYQYITKAINYFDIAADFGSLDKAMSRVHGKMLILSYSSDWLYPPYQSEEMVYSLARTKRHPSYCEIESDYGHDGFLLEVDVMTRIVSGFLHHVKHPVQVGRRYVRGKLTENDSKEFDSVLKGSIYAGRRIDYDRIVDLIEDGARVLDIGCGDGELLYQILSKKKVDALGVEIDQEKVVRCIERGVAVVHADIDKGLSPHPDHSYDYVILSMTLQVIKNPELVIREALRVGKRAIVSFPNFAFWKVRAKSLLSGRAPVTRNMPYPWYLSPNRHVLSIKDFREFCAERNLRIEKEIAISSHGRGNRDVTLWPNLFADEAVFVISAE